MKEKLSVIYDMTRQCPWNCTICCMGAVADKNCRKDELNLKRKLSLMDDLAEVNNSLRDVYIDFSGGEIFTNEENIRVIEKAAQLLGKEKVGISSSGYKIDDSVAQRLSHCISDCEMTMDVVPGKEYKLRPFGYGIAAEKAIPHLQKYGIGTGIQTVLAHSNCNEDNLRALYEYLCSAGVDNWSILKFYPSGRGAAYSEEVLTKEEEAKAVEFIKGLDKENQSFKKPKIDFHYTMKGHEKSSEECRCVRKSIGIMPNGVVTSCFWAINSSTGVVNPKYNLGSVKENSLAEIINSDRAAYWMNCTHKCELLDS